MTHGNENIVKMIRRKDRSWLDYDPLCDEYLAQKESEEQYWSVLREIEDEDVTRVEMLRFRIFNLRMSIRSFLKI
jgi:hypothetical protein